VGIESQIIEIKGPGSNYTASLDEEAAADAVGLLLDTARKQGATLMIATHDARVAQLIPAEINDQIGF